MSNSIKYSEPHTVIDIYCRKHDGYIEIEVKDRGTGIEKEKIDNLFKPFAQVNFRKPEKGTGLGLYISKAIVDEHHGKIWLNSTIGEGTSVFFTLPMTQEKVEIPRQTLAN